MRYETEKGNTGPDRMVLEGATLTVDEAHALIGTDKISRGGFYAAIRRREVPHVRLGYRILIPRQAFMRWLELAGAQDDRRIGG